MSKFTIYSTFLKISDGKELQLDGSEVLVLNKYGQMIGAGLGYPGEQEGK